MFFTEEVLHISLLLSYFTEIHMAFKFFYYFYTLESLCLFENKMEIHKNGAKTRRCVTSYGEDRSYSRNLDGNKLHASSASTKRPM